VQCLTNCVSRDGSNENLAHICFECPFTLQVWQRIGLWDAIYMELIEKNSTTDDAIFELLHQFLQELS